MTLLLAALAAGCSEQGSVAPGTSSTAATGGHGATTGTTGSNGNAGSGGGLGGSSGTTSSSSTGSGTGSGGGCSAAVDDWWNKPDRDITFVAFGDAHHAIAKTGCRLKGNFAPDQNMKLIAAINAIESAAWPAGHSFAKEGKTVSHVRGLLIAGDLTENGSEPNPEAANTTCPEWQDFVTHFGLCGDGLVKYPVYEGYGNHDFPFRAQFDDYHPVVGLIQARNPKRPGVVDWSHQGEPTAHYVWRWDDILFVNTDVKPAGDANDPHYEDIDKGDNRKRRVDPHRALSFLDAMLTAHLDGTRQLVLMSHYGPANGSRFPLAERQALCDVLTAHQARVIAWIHGHTHKSDAYSWTCGAVEVPVFNVGSAFHAEAENAGQVHFGLFRIGKHWLEAVDVSAPVQSPTQHQLPGKATPSDQQGQYNPDGKWGGWARRVPILAP